MSQILDQPQLVFNNTQQAYQKIIQIIQQAHETGVSLDKLERKIFAALLSLGHASLKDFIEAAGDGDQGSELSVGDQVVKRSAKKEKCTYW